MSKYEVRYVGDWISYIYDNETKESVRISNEDFVRLLNKQDKQISDLEAKLVESNESHHKNIVELTKMEIEKDRKIQELKQQLAEKEERYVQSLIKLEKEYDEQLEKQAKIHYRHLKEKDQDKISFAVEQLEKVKNRIQEDFDYDDLMYWLNNQIEELKKGVE